VQIGTGGQVSFYNLAGTVDVTADVSGYYLPAGSDAPETETLVFSPRGIDWLGGDLHEIQACDTRSGISSARGRMPITLPIGAQINNLESRVIDGSSTQPYEVELVRRRASTSGVIEAVVLEVTGGSSTTPAVTTDVAFSSASFAVTATDSYFFDIKLGAPAIGANAFCGASLSVTMP
jgi:hypothetical protein